jgi:hypothetical protein
MASRQRTDCRHQLYVASAHGPHQVQEKEKATCDGYPDKRDLQASPSLPAEAQQ